MTSESETSVRVTKGYRARKRTGVSDSLLKFYLLSFSSILHSFSDSLSFHEEQQAAAAAASAAATASGSAHARTVVALPS